jgi:hypothetical protein
MKPAFLFLICAVSYAAPSTTAAPNCTTYDDWPCRLRHRTGYAAQLTGGQLKKQLAARPGVWPISESEVRRAPPHRRGSTLRPQHALYVHRRAAAGHPIP